MEDTFSAIGIFSGGVRPVGMFDSYDLSWAFEDPEKFNRLIKVFFVSAGEQEMMYESNKEFLQRMKEEKGINSVFYSRQVTTNGMFGDIVRESFFNFFSSDQKEGLA